MVGKVNVPPKVATGHRNVDCSVVKVPPVSFECLSCVVVVAEKNASVCGNSCSHCCEVVMRIVGGFGYVLHVCGPDRDDQVVVSQSAW